MNRAFTLLEVLVVLVIMTLLIAITGVRLNAPYQEARLEETIQRIEFADHQARNHAAQHGTPCQLIVDLDEGQLSSHRVDDENEFHFQYRLPRAVRFDRVITPWIDNSSGTVRIDISSYGTSPTYAVRVVTAHDVQRWVLFAGLTGRVDYPHDNQHVQQIFTLWQPPGIDAD